MAFIVLLRLIRFSPVLFVGAGAGLFFLHHLNVAENISLVFIGPILYLAAAAQHFLTNLLNLKISKAMMDFGFLLPTCLIYFGGLGFLFKQLLVEKGLLKILSIVAIIGFVLFIHFMAWNNLIDYIRPVPAF